MKRPEFSRRVNSGPCAIDGCDKPAKSRGWCYGHYRRWLDHGDPLEGRTSRLPWIAAHAQWQGDACLRWPFSNGDWYHAVNVAPGKWSKAHRLMCEAAHGPAPTGAYALHGCGNKWCVNPRHLRWGTQSENIEDAKRHGTYRYGETAPGAKLTENDVRAARRDRAAGMSYSALARKYGIAQGAIWHAVNGSQWRHVE